MTSGSEAVETAIKFARQYQVAQGKSRALQGHWAMGRLSWRDARSIGSHRETVDAGSICPSVCRYAAHPTGLLLSVPLWSGISGLQRSMR